MAFYQHHIRPYNDPDDSGRNVPDADIKNARNSLTFSDDALGVASTSRWLCRCRRNTAEQTLKGARPSADKSNDRGANSAFAGMAPLLEVSHAPPSVKSDSIVFGAIP